MICFPWPLPVCSGFTHSAFVFGCESTVSKVNIDGKDVPIGALVSFIQKGFQFMELEANLTDDGSDVYGKYASLSARDILTKDLKELREAAKELKLRDAPEEQAAPAGAAGGPSAQPISQQPIEIPSTALRQLEGHEAEVLSVSWSPAAGSLATGSADGSARIWNISTGRSVQCSADTAGDMIIGVEWSPDGKILAAITGTGSMLLFNPRGALLQTCPNPTGALTLALQWSRGGTYLASGGADGTVTVWDPSSGSQTQQWTMPGDAPVFDLHWRNDQDLAAAGEDGCVAIFRVGKTDAVRASKEHGLKMEGAGAGAAAFSGAVNPETVNMVRWDPSGNHLASASNDMTVGVWERDPDAPPRLLTGHKREVGWVAWRCTSPQDGNEPLLASGSSDGSVRLWTLEPDNSGRNCVGVLDQHEEGITCVAWSPDGNRVVAGDSGGLVTVWGLIPGGTGARAGRVLSSLRGNGQVADVQWLKDGTTLAVAFSGNLGVTLVDLPKL